MVHFNHLMTAHNIRKEILELLDGEKCLDFSNVSDDDLMKLEVKINVAIYSGLCKVENSKEGRKNPPKEMDF